MYVRCRSEHLQTLVTSVKHHAERVYPDCSGVSLRPVHADPAAAGRATRPRRRRGEPAERAETEQRDAAGTAHTLTMNGWGSVVRPL